MAAANRDGAVGSWVVIRRRVSSGVAAEGGLAREEFVEDGAQSVDVGGRSKQVLFPPGLLGSHVARRAEDLAGAGMAGVVIEAFGEAEVGDLGSAVGGEHDVGRLEVAMNDAAFMGGVHGACERFDQLGGVPGRKGSVGELLGQAAARDEFHREKRPAVDLADFEDLHDIGVLQPGRGFRLGAKRPSWLGPSRMPAIVFSATRRPSCVCVAS